MKREQAIKFRRTIEAAAALQTDEAALDNIYLYPKWEEGIAVSAGDRYRDEDFLYKCVQSHTTQADWHPKDTPALWTVVSLDEWPEWKQPTGAADAYNKGNKVTFQGEHYISTIDGNVWSPADYPAGWEKQA